MDKSMLASGGIAQAVRGPLTVTKLRNALGRADGALWDLLEAAERHHFSSSTEDEAELLDDEDDYAEYGEYEYEYEPEDADTIDVDALAAVHTLAEINDEVATAAGRFTGVIRGVIAEVTTAAHTTNGYAPVLVADPSEPYPSNGHHDADVVVPVQPVVVHDDLDEEDEAYDAGDPAEYDEELEQEPVTYDARIVTIASATGGCGKTFFATSIATVLARMGWKVLLVDLDLQFGEVAAALQIQHPYSIYDGLYKTNGQRLEEGAFVEHLPELVCHHELGFDVLTAPRDPALADYVGARDAGVVLDSVVDRYDVVLVDTPPSLNDVVIAALDRSDVIEVLATPDVPSLRNLTTFIDILGRLGLEDSRMRLVLNKVDSDVGVTVAQANEAFDGRFKTLLPSDRAVSRAVNRGTTAPAHEPRSKISRAITPAVVAMAEDLVLHKTAVSMASPVAVDVPPSNLRRMWRALSGGKS
jgi:MinD-like ATPase involved in chromosome partitioning or flagellar assembly